ncbi:MAG: FHA domain-containing protein [Chloroflexota bacterium]
MTDASGVAFLFILVGGLVLVLLLLVADKGQGKLIFGKAEVHIDFEKSQGWIKTPSKHLTGYYLTVRGTNWRYPLGHNAVYIGRRPDCDITLNDSAAATRQAVIYWQDGRYKINNLSRYAPTRVNNRPITMQNLGDGNTIQLGRTKLIFRKGDLPPRAAR